MRSSWTSCKPQLWLPFCSGVSGHRQVCASPPSLLCCVCCVVLFCRALFCRVLPYDVLCHAVPCCAVLCCATHKERMCPAWLLLSCIHILTGHSRWDEQVASRVGCPSHVHACTKVAYLCLSSSHTALWQLYWPVSFAAGPTVCFQSKLPACCSFHCCSSP